ncbi:unnamed protein product [Rotaria sp. Silwood1]|nr:unnamed protein product [Rotaria sp. Silwood1]
MLAYTVFPFFPALINARYSAKVNEWTLLSMTNIAQRKSICMAIWELTCLRFLLTLSRFSAHFKKLDNRLFLISDREYYLQLTNIEQRRQFKQAFINESNPKKLYADLLAHIQNTILSWS